jgi:beta-fructofuranosidase
MAPPPELSTLRYNEKFFDEAVLDGGNELTLDVANGESCDIEVVVDPGAADAVGLKVRTSPDDGETTRLFYDTSGKKLVFDSSRSGGKGRKVIEQAPFALGEKEPLRLRVLIDKSVVEFFANDRQAITRRVYPETAESDQVRLYCAGGKASFRGIRTWEMMPSNPW